MSRARRSLRDRDETAIDNGHQATDQRTDQPTDQLVEQATDEPAGQGAVRLGEGTAAATGPTDRPARSRAADAGVEQTPRSAAPSAGTVRVGIYFRSPEIFDNAKGAYLSDWEQLPDSADTFAGWVADAIQRHCDRGPAERQRIAPAGPDGPGRGGRESRTFIVPIEVRTAATTAIGNDGRAGRWLSLSEFCGEAIAIAVDAARGRAGGQLPAAPARLPNRLHR